MRRLAYALLTAFLFAFIAFANSPAQAGGYGYSDDGYYYGGGYRHHRDNDVVVVYDVPPRHRYYRDGYVRRHRHVWYTSSCCYRKVVRHTRSVWYERVHRRHRRVYYGDYYVRPHRYTSYWPHYRRYAHHHYGDYLYRPYRTYDLGYTRVGYRGYGYCRRIPLADGRGGWVWSRRAGCF